jgi:hypothetical protein
MSATKRSMHLQRDLPLPLVVLLFVLGLVPFALLFSSWTSSSPWAFPRFALTVLLVIYLPGKFLVDSAKLRLRLLEEVMLSLVLGMTVSSLVYWLTAFLGVWPLFLLWPAAALAGAIYRRRSSWRDTSRFRVRLDVTHLLLCGVIAVQLVPLALLPMYYRNVVSQPQGTMTFLSRPRDAIFHLSIAHELKHSVPPEVPYLAGQPLGYHYGMDLLTAMLSNVGGLSVLDLTVRFTPTLLLVMTTLAIFCFSRVWLGSGYGAALSAFLVILGEDFSFVPGLLLGSEEVWSVQFFQAPSSFSLYFMNPMLPALGILFAGLFCLERFLSGHSKSWLVLAGFLFAVTMEYKIFVIAQVLLVLAIAAVVYAVLHRDRALISVFLVTVLLVLPLALYAALGTEEAMRVGVRFDPWPYVPQALEQLGLGGTWLSREVGGLYAGGGASVTGIVALLLLALPIYVVGSLGFRTLALPGVLKGVLAPSRSAALRFCLGLLVLVGPVLALTFWIIPLGYPVETEYNEAIWFYVPSKYVATILAVEMVLVLCRGRRLWVHALVVCAAVVLSIPSTVQFFQIQMSDQLVLVSESEQELTRFLGERCLDGEVVLSRQQVGAPVAALTQCRVPVLNMGAYTHSFVSPEGLDERRADRDRFWSAWNGGDLRTEILKRYGVDYVVVDRRAGDETWDEAVPSSAQTPDTPGSVTLTPLFDNVDFIVYGVRTADEPTA